MCKACLVSLSREYNGCSGKPRRGAVSSTHLGVPCQVLQNVFQFLRGTACSVHTTHEKGTCGAFLTLIYQQTMTRIKMASEACGLVHYTIYISQGEAAAQRLSLLCLKCIPSFNPPLVADFCDLSWLHNNQKDQT